MKTSIIDVENTSLINKDECSNNEVPPYYKIWVVIKVNLRKEALTLAKDLLLNSKVFLDCDGKKEKFFEIIRDIKNETQKTADKLVSNFTNIKQENTKGCEEYKYSDLPKKEDMKEYNEQLQQVDINNIPIYTINTLIKLRSPDPTKYKWKNEVDAKIIKMNEDRTYNVKLKYNSSTIKNVSHIYITPVNNVEKGGYRKSRKYKRKSKKRKTKKRRK
jgi:hypothetical protein